MPVRQPSDRKLTTSTIASASAKVWTNSETDSSTMWGWSAICVTSMPTGSSAMIALIARLQVLAEREDVAAVLHRDAEAERRLAAFAHEEGRRILVAALDRRDVAEPEHLAVRPATGTAAIASTPENAPVTRRLMRSAEVSTEPPETTAFCLATLSKICCGVTPSVASLAWLNSMKIFSAARR